MSALTELEPPTLILILVTLQAANPPPARRGAQANAKFPDTHIPPLVSAAPAILLKSLPPRSRSPSILSKFYERHDRSIRHTSIAAPCVFRVSHARGINTRRIVRRKNPGFPRKSLPLLCQGLSHEKNRSGLPVCEFPCQFEEAEINFKVRQRALMWLGLRSLAEEGREDMKMASYPNALGVAAVAYVGVDYLRELAPGLHAVLQPLLWGFFAAAATVRSPFYEYWTQEMRSIRIFLSSLVFMLACLCIEAMAVQYVTTVLGLDWHWSTTPLPDSGQWLILFSNKKLPESIVDFLRAPVLGLHHYLMLFLLLAFSVLYGCVKVPGMGLGARYMFTMGVGRLIRVLTFTATILPSARPWCAQARFKTPHHPHPWAQKYYIPYAKDPNMVREVINQDVAFAPTGTYPAEYVPNWGLMQVLVNILRPMDPVQTGQGQENWFNTLKRAGGGCNDLIFSGHMYVAVLTAMAWQEAYPGWTSVFIWALVAHTGQREIRERHHYSVDVVTGVYVGILVWRTTKWIWSAGDRHKELRIKQLAAVEDDIQKAAKEGDLEKIRSMLSKINKSCVKNKDTYGSNMFSGGFILFVTLGLGLLTFTWTADG